MRRFFLVCAILASGACSLVFLAITGPVLVVLRRRDEHRAFDPELDDDPGIDIDERDCW